MNKNRTSITPLLAAATVAIGGVAATSASATAPCGGFGECKVLVEVNSTDGDIGFHFLMDGDDLNSARFFDPDGVRVFRDQALGPMRDQKLTETFAESAEPLCWPDPDADPDDDIVTLEDFIDTWTPGTYSFIGLGDDGEVSVGETTLGFDLPAAPTGLSFDEVSGVISWSAGDDLGNCASNAELTALVGAGTLPVHPQDVPVAMWEVVFEADVESDHPADGLKLTVRVPTAQTSVTVPADFLAAMPDDTPAKMEVGAIGTEDNATFTEEGDICVNENAGCVEE